MWTPTRRALSHQSEPSSCGRATASNPAAVLAFPAERTPPSPWQTLRTRTSLMTNQVRDKLSERGSVRKSKTRVRICYKSVFTVWDVWKNRCQKCATCDNKFTFSFGSFRAECISEPFRVPLACFFTLAGQRNRSPATQTTNKSQKAALQWNLCLKMRINRRRTAWHVTTN